MKYCIIGTHNSQIIDILNNYGYKCIHTIPSADVSGPICTHADVLYLKDDKTLYISHCQDNNAEFLHNLGYTVKTVKLNPGYKTECRLNVVVTDDIVLYNPKTAIENIGNITGDKHTIQINQGYTKCSTIVVRNGFITEDTGVFTALSRAGKNVLLIDKGHVSLKGYNYGFIGGASVWLQNVDTLLFFGNITQHPDYGKIVEFCSKMQVYVEYIKDMELTDIGGAVVI